jgi:hypothetical protein
VVLATAHDYAAHTPGAELPDRVRSLTDLRAAATNDRKMNYQASLTEGKNLERRDQARGEHLRKGRDRSSDNEIEL